MSTATLPLSDHDIRAAVQDELEWTPEVDAAAVGVSVEDGAVTLLGEVGDYAERLAAKRAALRVRGVRTVVDEMTVHPKAFATLTETDIAKEIQQALTWATNVPDSVKAELNRHHVTLTGEVQWEFERLAAQRAVQFLRGIAGVNNMITLAARPSAVDAEERIRNALLRNAQLDANHITVTVLGNRATLTGHVQSWAEKSQAGSAAWASPHVTTVDNKLIVNAS